MVVLDCSCRFPLSELCLRATSDIGQYTSHLFPSASSCQPEARVHVGVFGDAVVGAVGVRAVPDGVCPPNYVSPVCLYHLASLKPVERMRLAFKLARPVTLLQWYSNKVASNHHIISPLYVFVILPALRLFGDRNAWDVSAFRSPRVRLERSASLTRTLA